MRCFVGAQHDSGSRLFCANEVTMSQQQQQGISASCGEKIK